tara:strand:- start:2865 stop:3152 length:288 start_codon:yes stop_codon:yes gene_type:complete
MKENEEPQEPKREIFELSEGEYRIIQEAVDTLTDFKASRNRMVVQNYNVVGSILENRAIEVGFVPNPNQQEQSGEKEEDKSSEPSEPVEAEIVDK